MQHSCTALDIGSIYEMHEIVMLHELVSPFLLFERDMCFSLSHIDVFLLYLDIYTLQNIVVKINMYCKITLIYTCTQET